MYTKEKQRECMREMRMVLHNPIAAVSMLRSMKRGTQSRFSFVGYTSYFFRYNGCNNGYEDLIDIDPLTPRSLRYDRAVDSAKQMMYEGVVSEKQYRYILMSLLVINTTIKRYFPLYLFL